MTRCDRPHAHRPTTTAVICARNEATTLDDVLATVTRALAGSVLREVIVVDDHSTDATAALADAWGAIVLQPEGHRGKGHAMRCGWRRALANGATQVLFLDGDLRGLQPHHVARLVATATMGHFAMVSGLRDYGPLGNLVQRAIPPITGERVVAGWLLEEVPAMAWEGYRAEAALEEACRIGRHPTCAMVLEGVSIRMRHEKLGLVRGLRGYVEMAREIRTTQRRVRAELAGDDHRRGALLGA